MSPTKKRNDDLTKANDDTEEEKKWLDGEDEVNTHRSGYCKISELFKNQNAPCKERGWKHNDSKYCCMSSDAE